MAKRKGKGSNAAKKPTKPRVEKAGRATQAKEPEGAKAGKPKGKSSKTSQQAGRIVRKMSKAKDAKELAALQKQLASVSKKFNRKSTRESYAQRGKSASALQSTFIRTAGGARKFRKLSGTIKSIQNLLGKRGKDIAKATKSLGSVNIRKRNRGKRK